MKTSDELNNLVIFLKHCDEVKTKLAHEQEYEKASKYRDLSKKLIKLINYVSGTANELLTEKQKEEIYREKAITSLMEETGYIMK